MRGRSSRWAAIARDPRAYQIAALSTLLVLGLTWFDFDITLPHVAVTLTSALAGQWWATRMGWPARPILAMGAPAASTSPPRFEWRSALISGLSLCLLLRAPHAGWMALAGLVAVWSKFLLRVPRAGAAREPGPAGASRADASTKHILNPTNGAIVLLLLAGAPVWVSPAQWGHHLPLAFGIAGFGSLVVHRSARSDVTLAFLAAWAAVLFGRAAWVGQPWSVPLHQLENGGLVLYAFHMISDPKTTPDSRAGRIVFACLTALGAGFVQFVLFRTNGLLWSLAACSLLVPLLDRVLPGRAFDWSAPGTGARHPEVRHAVPAVPSPGRAVRGARTA
jgi:Na+-transporting NADH:ubiquinone oxidoreductase subunit NqrB